MKRYKVRVLGTELLFIIVTLCYLYKLDPPLEVVIIVGPVP